MNRLWIAILFSCSANLSAAEHADFTLKWKTEQKKVPGPILHWRKAQEQDPILRWREEQKKLALKPPPEPIPEQDPRKRLPSGRVNKAHRQLYVDPNFSSFNSDPGYSNHAEFRTKRD